MMLVYIAIMLPINSASGFHFKVIAPPLHRKERKDMTK